MKVCCCLAMPLEQKILKIPYHHKCPETPVVNLTASQAMVSNLWPANHMQLIIQFLQWQWVVACQTLSCFELILYCQSHLAHLSSFSERVCLLFWHEIICSNFQNFLFTFWYWLWRSTITTTDETYWPSVFRRLEVQISCLPHCQFL